MTTALDGVLLGDDVGTTLGTIDGGKVGVELGALDGA